MVSGHQEAFPHPFKAQTFPILCLREEICYELMDFTDQLMFMETKIINYALDKFSRNALREHFHCSISYTELSMELGVVELFKLITV